ncbi:alpha/beta fold hydrolase [Maribellus sediminis]|uniref:alpha/beta fold hydrolase n=1 Tax=Maribellus sediminis TaxID=2696285 RepID=UPI001981CAF0|nr:alpha/beta hydrolase [Maribellus sediminis]
MKQLAIIAIVLSSFAVMAQKQVVYLIPGQGADARLYKNIHLDSIYEVRNITYSTPEKGWNMSDFAHHLANQIDTTREFSIVGVSLGGMLATEMNDFLHPRNVVLISSAKSRKELPFRYRFQRVIPIHEIIPGAVIKVSAKILQPIVEPDRGKDASTFKAMLRDKDPKFMKRTVKMILEWKRQTYDERIIHIHGDLDKTIPARNVSFDYLVEDGSHMMVLTKGDLISDLLNEILSETSE